MRRRVIIAFLVAVLSAMAGLGILLLARPAHAAPASQHTAITSYAVAESFWQARGLDPCNGTLVQRVLPEGVLGRGYYKAGGFADGDPFCTILMNKAENWRELGAWFSATGPEAFCSTVVHERGHNAGKRHAPLGIMTATMSTVPRACRLAL